MTTRIKLGGRLTVVLVAMALAQLLRAQSAPIQYYYDDAGRIVTVVDSSGNVASYVYDAVGNILQINRSAVIQGQLAIFDFNPKVGPVGIPVTIRGQGFSATPSLDTVKFSGTVANVTSATTTTLVATVPIGATTGPISVTVGTNAVTSAVNFTVVSIPTITSAWPKSTLYNAVIPTFQVTGTNLQSATFFFNAGELTISNVSISSLGTSATMTVTVGRTTGTFTLVAVNGSGNSGEGVTPANRFTVVYPYSTADTDGDGIIDAVEAAYGTDPLDPRSYPNGNSVPLVGGVNSLPFSVLNTLAPPGASEADGVPFSALNTSSPGTPAEAEGIIFSVQNNASLSKTLETTKPIIDFGPLDIGGDNSIQSPSESSTTTSTRNSAGSAPGPNSVGKSVYNPDLSQR